jgi:exopolysaccharide production protein ExoY
MSTGSALATSPAIHYGSLIAWMERVASLLLLVLLSPLLLLVAGTVAVLSRRSPLVAHLRVGRFGEPLWTLKFRTMWPGSASPAKFIERIVDESGMDYKASYDPRVNSRFARFLRQYSIDEIPQLVHVVRGSMALVGPRPLTQTELKKHYGADADTILTEKPGITGLWQVSGRSRLSYEQRRAMDLFLVGNRSFRLYLTILLRTAMVVVRGQDGW